MKQPIKWHMECLKNANETHRKRKQRLLDELKEVDADLADDEFYRRQIEEAKKRGMDGFDRDRFLVKRK